MVRDKINAANAGVNATIVSDASGSRLVMKSTSSGAASGFQVTQASGGTLDALTYNGPGDIATPASGTQAAVKKLTQAGGDAVATINGLSITSASNTLTDVIDGVSLKLSKVSADPVEVSVNADTETLKTAITDFAKAYNDLQTYLTNETKFVSGATNQATFQGDSGVNALRSALRNLGSSSGGASTTLSRLSQIGLDIKTDGTISTTSAKLDSALTNVDELKKMFVGTTSTPGLGVNMRKWSDDLLGSTGALTTRTSSLQRQLTANSKQQSSFEDRLTAIEKRLRAQYSALDTQMANINQQSGYVTQQITAWSKSSG